jgi:hypothetical protein
MQFSISMIIISLLLHLKASGTRKGRDFQVGGGYRVLRAEARAKR